MPTHPLVFHSSPDQTIAWRDGAPVSVRTFVADVARVAAVLPAGGHVFNVCRDRYRFAVGLCAALVAGKVSLLPSTHTPEMVRQLASFAPDAFCLHDAPDCTIDLPRFAYPEAAAHAGGDDDAACVVPQIDASRLVAYVFTSGSSGTPVPHRKTWGGLVGCVRAAAERLALLDGRAATLIGTVPPQHMYGFESTVLLALIGGLAFSNRQPFYPGDIRDELAALPQPRVLVTSPVHLRALLSAGHAAARGARAVGHRAAVGKARGRSGSRARRAARRNLRQHRDRPDRDAPHVAGRRVATVPRHPAGRATRSTGRARTPRATTAARPSGRRAATSRRRCRWATRSNCSATAGSCCTAARPTSSTSPASARRSPI
jgi:hypothetical protein